MTAVRRRIEAFEQRQAHDADVVAVVTRCRRCGELCPLADEAPCGTHQPVTGSDRLIVEFVEPHRPASQTP
jgi:hypothetical protein